MKYNAGDYLGCLNGHYGTGLVPGSVLMFVLSMLFGVGLGWHCLVNY